MNLLHTIRTTSRRGSAMLAGIFVVLVISTLSMSYLQLSLNKSSENSASIDAKRAFYMAEAGLAEGYAALTCGQSGVVASPEAPAVYANGVFWVEATPLSPTRTMLRSTGLSGTGRDSLTVVLERTTQSLAEYGIFGDEGVRVGLGATIETYDSRTLDPGTLEIGDKNVLYETGATRLRVGSNQDITIVGDKAVSTVIDGDVIPGPLGSVVIGPGVSVTGSTTPAAEAVNLTTIDLPHSARDAGSLVWSSVGQTYLHEPAICAYSSFNVTAGKVVIQGPAKLAIHQLNLAAGAELGFDTTAGPVRLYVGGSMILDTGSILSSVQQDPTQLMIAIGAADRTAEDGSDINAVRLGATGEFYGFIYSPLADLRVNPNINYYGTMIGKEVNLSPGATLHFDEALLDVLTDGSTIMADQLSWRFVELPEADIVKTRIDPIRWMKLQGVTLSKPSETHDNDWDGKVDATDISENITKETIVN